jgi:hypothetical protein
VFQELKRYLTSPPVMLALEPSEPLLLYIVATSEAMSMVLVAERPGPHSPLELRSSSTDGLGSQDLGPTEEPRIVGASGSQPPEVALGPHDQTVMGSQTSEVPPDLEDRELKEPHQWK